VARDRQRAKQRKARRAQHSGPAPSQPRRSDVPGELQHASGEVDEFEAALVSGADGETVDDEPDTRAEVEAQDDLEANRAEVDAQDDLEANRAEVEAQDDLDVDPSDDDDLPALADEDDDVDDATLEREAAAATPRREATVAPGTPTRKGAGRFVGFLRASWAELQRVQWPDRRQVAQATGVVIGFVIVAGLYLGLADWVAKQVVNVII
jgi:preprotein translocase subunit SecE